MCGGKLASIIALNEMKIIIYGKRNRRMQSEMTVIKAHKCVRKGCKSFLAYILDSTKEKKKIEDVKVLRDFMEAFLEELPGFPPIR